MSRNGRIALIFGGFVTAVAAAFYPIYFYPLTHKNEYSKCLIYFLKVQLHIQTVYKLNAILYRALKSICRFTNSF